MKTIQFILFRVIVVVVAMFLAVGCKKDNLSVALESNTLEFTADGGKKSVDVNTNVKTWEASTSVDWMSIVGRSKVDFSVKVEKYTDPTRNRVGEITITAGDAKPITLTVTQLAPSPNTLSVTPVNITFASGETGYKTVTVTTDATSWDATTTATWLTLPKQGNTIRVTPAGLNTGETRSAEIRVTAGSANPVLVTVTQSKTEIDTRVPTGKYNATGIPYSTAPSTWSGIVGISEDKTYYGISNWANINSELILFLDDKNGKLFLDNYTMVAEDNTYKYYFRAVYQSGGNWADAPELVVNYNAATKTLDFSGTYNGYQVFVGLVGQNKSTLTWSVFSNSLVSSAKLVITPNSSSSLQNSNLQPSENMSAPPPPPTGLMKSIVVDKSQLEKGPVHEIRIFEAGSLRELQK